MLTDKALKALKPREKPYKRGDDKGLYVIVRPDGAIRWVRGDAVEVVDESGVSTPPSPLCAPTHWSELGPETSP